MSKNNLVHGLIFAKMCLKKIRSNRINIQRKIIMVKLFKSWMEF